MRPLKAPQRLGLAAATALVLGNMVGSGIFLLPSSLAPYGAVSLVGWLFTSAGAILLALVFAHLAARLPGSGGPYVYARAGFGEFGGFFVAWGYWISIWAGNAAIAVAFASYRRSCSAPRDAVRGALAAIAGVWFLTALNAGEWPPRTLPAVTTVLKVVPLLLFAILALLVLARGVRALNPSGKPLFRPSRPSRRLTLWSFLGLESVDPGGRRREPRAHHSPRDAPRHAHRRGGVHPGDGRDPGRCRGTCWPPRPRRSPMPRPCSSAPRPARSWPSSP
jgi:APA family basic amino acid/polyamine antiporter